MNTIFLNKFIIVSLKIESIKFKLTKRFYSKDYLNITSYFILSIEDVLI